MVRRSAVLVLTMLLISACGGAVNSERVATSSPPATVAGTSPGQTGQNGSTVPPGALGTVPPCHDLPELAAPEDWYGDEPDGLANDLSVLAVRAWAGGRPGFQDAWIDNERFGWITVAFTGEVAARQAELELEFPDGGAVAVEVPTTLDHLTTLQEQAHRLVAKSGVPFGGSGIDPPRWVVGLDGNAADERLASVLAPLAGERICLNDTGVPPPEGPQPEAGDDWRLLGEGLVGETYRTGIATTDDQYSDLWERAGLSTPVPPVDFVTEVVVWFGAVYGSSCPIRLDDVAVVPDGDPALVHAVTVVPGGTGACTDDANPHAYVVAVERDRLPAGPFVVQLGADDPPPGAPRERTVVDVDLSVPGAVSD